MLPSWQQKRSVLVPGPHVPVYAATPDVTERSPRHEQNWLPGARFGPQVTVTCVRHIPALHALPLGHAQSAQHVALVSPVSHRPLPHTVGVTQALLRHVWPLAQGQSAQHVALDSPVSHRPLPHDAAVLRHAPPTHEDPAAHPQSAQHVSRLSPAEHAPSPQRADAPGTHATHDAPHAPAACAAVA